MIELKPLNKYLVIDAIKEDQKIGSLYIPGNSLEKQYRLAKVIAKDDCEEAKSIDVGDTVLYDAIGMVTHRINDKSYSTVKALNVIGVVKQTQGE